MFACVILLKTILSLILSFGYFNFFLLFLEGLQESLFILLVVSKKQVSHLLILSIFYCFSVASGSPLS